MFSWLNTIPWFTSSNSYLTYFYQFPWKFVDWLEYVFNIKENWISILITVLFVCLVFYTLFYFSMDHNK